MAAPQRTTPYPEGLYREQLPTWLTWAATWAGHAVPDTSRPFRYADLGCGIGLTACWVKRLYPHAEVIGIDADPEHIRASRALAEAMSVEVTFHQARFDDAPILPPIDIAIAHGVWSWIDADARTDLVQLLERSLAPGALAYIDYNTLPGRTDWVPVARLLRTLTQQHEGVGDDDVGGLARAMAAVGALDGHGFFGARPGLIAGLLEQLRRHPGHTVHEFLSPGWEAYLLADVARDLAPADLSYVASTHLSETVEELRTTDEERALLAPHPDPVTRHTVRDFLRTTVFRHDLFQRDGRHLSADARTAALLERRYALGCDPKRVSLEAPGGYATSPLPPDTTELLQALDGPPSTARSVAAALGWSDDVVIQRIGLLCAAGTVFPAEAELFPGAVNDLMAQDVDQLPVLSPSGMELVFHRVDRAIWRAWGSDDVVGKALELLASEGHHLVTATGDPEAQRAAMGRHIDAFQAAIPDMVRAGWSWQGGGQP